MSDKNKTHTYTFTFAPMPTTIDLAKCPPEIVGEIFRDTAITRLLETGNFKLADEETDNE